MTAVTKVNPSLATPAGEARIRRGKATVEIKRGQIVTIDDAATPGSFHETAWKLAPDTASGIGIANKDAAVNATVEVVIDGEVGGYSGLPKGQYLSVVDGELDDTEPVIEVDVNDTPTEIPARSRFYAYSDTVVMVL